MTEPEIERLKTAVSKLNVTVIPEDIMVKLRARYGLVAEYYAHLLAMSETEFREYVEGNMKQQKIDLSEEIRARKELEQSFWKHHHHWFSREPCTSDHIY